MLGPAPSGQSSTRSVHHQYSGSVSPFQAYTGTPAGASTVPVGPTTTAAAAWSWVEKMLQLAHRTCAPRATSVSMSTAVWIVMCSDPVMRAPRSGWASAYSRRSAIRPGISCSASWISLRPNAASDRSATLKSPSVSDLATVSAGGGSVLVMTTPVVGGVACGGNPRPYAAAERGGDRTGAACGAVAAGGLVRHALHRPALPPGLVSPRAPRNGARVTLRTSEVTLRRHRQGRTPINPGRLRQRRRPGRRHLLRRPPPVAHPLQRTGPRPVPRPATGPRRPPSPRR